MQQESLHSCYVPAVSIAANWLDMTGLEADTQFVKELCRWAKRAPSALAKEAGLTPTTLLRPFNGMATTRLSQPTIDKLRAKFPGYPGWRREFPDQVAMLGDRADPNEKPDELVYIREVDISYAMGEGAEVSDYPAVGLIPFNLGFVRALSRATTDSIFIATGHGESMETTLLRSDILMIDASQKDVRQSDLIWAFTFAGGGMIKRLRRVRDEGRDKFLIISDNPAVPDQLAEIEDVHIIGKLVWVGRRM